MAARVLAGRYELLEKIGEGGMAVVFKARDLMLDRLVALKILRPEYTTDKSFIDGFFRESQLVAGIVDPNIVQVYDVGQQGNIHYIVMELVEGETLAEKIKREGRLDAHLVVSYSKQIAKALATAHDNDLIHRDIKPHNIMITKDGVAKLTDFGIAKRLAPEDPNKKGEKEAVMGSIHYFSPEQARGISVDERSDIYSLGIVMYEMITGQVPYDGDNAVDVAVKHMNEPMVPPSKIAFEMPRELENIILKATAKKPDDRFDSAEDMLYALNFVKYSDLVDYKTEEQEIKEKEKETKSKKKKADEPKKKGHPAIVVTLLILIISVGVGAGKYILDKNFNNKTVTVPDLFELSYEEAEELLKEQGLAIEVESEILNENYPAGTVLSQTPSKDSVVKVGRAIKVNITKSSVSSKVPSLADMELSVATQRLESLGYTVGTITEIYSSKNVGYVISTDPAAGETVEKGSQINITVSKGVDPDNNTLFTFNLVGMTVEEAKAELAKYGCVVGTVNPTAGKGDENDGKIIRQYPSASKEVEAGTAFNLTVQGVKELGYIDYELDISSFEIGETIIVTIKYMQDGGALQILHNEIEIQNVEPTIEDPEESEEGEETGEGEETEDPAEPSEQEEPAEDNTQQTIKIVGGKGTGKLYVYVNTNLTVYDASFVNGTYSLSDDQSEPVEEESEETEEPEEEDKN